MILIIIAIGIRPFGDTSHRNNNHHHDIYDIGYRLLNRYILRFAPGVSLTSQ